MARQYKCYWCNEKDTDDKVVVKQGKQNKRYHKVECYDLYLKDKERKKKENEEKDKLTETIMEVHNIKTVPSQFFPFLEDIRNANLMFAKRGNKKYKEGYPYYVIEETYLQNKQAIEWAKRNKDFKDTLTFLKYTRAIIANKIDQVYQQMKRKEKQEQRQKIREEIEAEDNKQTFEEIKVQKPKANDDMDISKWI